MTKTTDSKRLIRDLREQGYEVMVGGSGHPLVRRPDGRTCHISSTPTVRGLLNDLANLKKKLGYVPSWDPNRAKKLSKLEAVNDSVGTN